MPVQALQYPGAPAAHPIGRGSITLFLLALLLAILAWPAPSLAQQPAAPTITQPKPSAAETQALLDTLQDPQKRAELVAQLRLMAEAQKAHDEAKGPTPLDATGQILRRLSARVGELSKDFVAAVSSAKNVHALTRWIQTQLHNPDRQALWRQVMVNLALTIGLGYLALYALRLALLPLRRRLSAHAPARHWVRLPLLLLLALMELIPIAAFAITAYLTLGYLAPRAETRLVALAWIQAVLLAQLAAVVARIVFAAGTDTLRLVPLSDTAARSGERWTRAFAQVGLYGYFGIQAAALLGLPRTAVDGFTRVLGLVILLMLMALVIRVRVPIEHWIRGRERDGGAMRELRIRLAAIWYIPVLLYLVVYAIWALDVLDGSTIMLKGTALTLVTVAVAAVIGQLTGRGIRRWLTPPALPPGAPPQLRTQLRRYRPVLLAAAHWAISGVALLVILGAWGLPSLTWITKGPGSTLTATLLTLVLTVVVALAIWEGTTLAISSYLMEHEDRATGTRQARSARAHTLLSVARTALLIVLSVVTALMVLTELGIDIAPMLAAAGVIGLAVGFGAQKLVQDIITGFFFLLENTFSVGDVIQVGDRSGLVESVSIRNVRLRDLAGTVHTIPFSTIDKVSNLTKDFSCFVFDVGIAYREDVEAVIALIQEIGQEMRKDSYFSRLILADIEVFGLDAFADSAVVIKGRIKTRAGKQWETGREFNRRIKKRFDALDIEIPFPHRTLYFGIDKDGNAPPLWTRRENVSTPAPRLDKPEPLPDPAAG